MEFKAKEIAEILKGTVDGNPEATVSSFARIENGKPGTICFFANPKYEQYVYKCKADIIIVNRTFVPQQEVSATLVRVDNAYASIAELLDYVTAKKRSYRRYRGRHVRRFLSTRIGKKVYIGDCSYIGRHASVGDYTKIYEQVYIGDGTRIGKHCIIYPGVKIYPGMEIGDNVIIHANAVIGSDGFGFAPLEDGTYKKIEHTGNVIIHDNVEIGANTTIDKSQMGATVIGKGVKIDNLCQIAHNVEIGDNTVMAALTGVAGSSKLGRHCVIGGQVGIAGHITIADNTSLGAQSGVLGSIKKEGLAFLGTPAIPYKEYLRSYAVFKKNGKE